MFGINPVFIVVIAVVVAAFLLFLISRLVEAYRQQASTGREQMPLIFWTNVFLFAFYRMVGARRGQPSAAREEIPITLLPKTSLGKWSLGLAIAFIPFLVAAVILAGSDLYGIDENGELFNPVLTVVLTIMVVGTSGAALVTGLISMIKRKERSVLVFVGIVIALWWGLLGAVGEFLI